jgi:uncharacterized protein (DUF983 family)
MRRPGLGTSYDRYTVPEPVCRRCGYRPESESGGDLKYHVIVLGIVVAVLLAAVVALFIRSAPLPGRIVQLQSDSYPSRCARLRLIVGSEAH